MSKKEEKKQEGRKQTRGTNARNQGGFKRFV